MRRPRLIRVASKPPLYVDFTGVLFLRRGSDDGGKIVGKPVPGAGEFLVNASKHFEVNIWSEHTAKGGLKTIQMLLVPALEGPCGSRNSAFTFVTEEIKWPTTRGDHFVFLDDRAVQFNGSFPDPAELLRFRPWHQREGGE